MLKGFLGGHQATANKAYCMPNLIPKGSPCHLQATKLYLFGKLNFQSTEQPTYPASLQNQAPSNPNIMKIYQNYALPENLKNWTCQLSTRNFWPLSPGNSSHLSEFVRPLAKACGTAGPCLSKKQDQCSSDSRLLSPNTSQHQVTNTTASPSTTR